MILHFFYKFFIQYELVQLNTSNVFPFSSCLCPLIHQSNFNSRQFSLVRFKKIIALKLSNTGTRESRRLANRCTKEWYFSYVGSHT